MPGSISPIAPAVADSWILGTSPRVTPVRRPGARRPAHGSLRLTIVRLSWSGMSRPSIYQLVPALAEDKSPQQPIMTARRVNRSREPVASTQIHAIGTVVASYSTTNRCRAPFSGRYSRVMSSRALAWSASAALWKRRVLAADPSTTRDVRSTQSFDTAEARTARRPDRLPGTAPGSRHPPWP